MQRNDIYENLDKKKWHENKIYISIYCKPGGLTRVVECFDYHGKRSHGRYPRLVAFVWCLIRCPNQHQWVYTRYHPRNARKCLGVSQ